jgi:maltose/moltooligosaccharide transporter
LGFSVQTLLIGIGAVAGSWLPYILGNWFGISKEAGSNGLVPDNVVFSFYCGAFVLLAAILWTIFTTSEYPPEQLSGQADHKPKGKFTIPPIMVKLLLVQFFSWFALFSMWVYTTPAVALRFYGTSDANAAAFQEAGNWVGILFGIYNGVSAMIALLLPVVAKKFSKKITHALALCIGGISLLSFLVFNDSYALLLPMIGIGIAWGSILAMPYAMLASSIPPARMGVYMGLFNMSITIPQIVSGIFSGLILKYFFANNPVLCIVMAGVSMLLGALSALMIKEDKEENKQ